MMKSVITLVLSIVTLTTVAAFSETPLNQKVDDPVQTELPKYGSLTLPYEDSLVPRMATDLDRRDPTLQVIDAYYHTVLAQKLLGIVEESIKLLEPMEPQSLTFYNEGVVPKTDVLWVRARIAETRLEQRRLQFEMRLSHAVLSRFLGYSSETRIVLEPSLAYSPHSYSIPGIYELAAARRSDMRSAKITKEEVMSLVTAAGPEDRARDPSATEERQVRETAEIEPSTKPKPITLSEALTRSVETQGRKKSAPVDSSSKEEISGPRRQLVLRVLQEVKTAYLTLKSSEHDIPVSLKAVKACTENFRIITSRYKEQVSSCLELVEAHRLLVRTQVAYIKALAAYRINLARLEKAMGILGAQPTNLEEKK